ncbi:MAG: 50S ribosomal protein L18 [bacterium]
MEKNTKRLTRIARHKRVRKKVSGTQKSPRMSVFRSARHIYVQVIDDIQSATIASASTLDREFRDKKTGGNKKKAAKWVGQEIARRAQEKGIKEVVFDRGGYKFHGRVKILAEAAKEAGLKF